MLVANFVSIANCLKNFLNQDSCRAVVSLSLRLSVVIYSTFLNNFSCSETGIVNQNSPLEVRAIDRSCHPIFHCCLVNLSLQSIEYFESLFLDMNH